MYATNQFRKGLKVEIDGVPFQIVDFQHVSPGKGSAFTRTKLKNMLTDTQIERTFKSGEKLHPANTEDKEMQFLFKDSEGYHFMDTTSYEQLALSEEVLGESAKFLQENLQIHVTLFNERPIGINLPNFVELKVVKTDPAFKGDTVSGGTKPALLESGASVNVPFHIKEGDVIKVDTRDGSYSEKANG